ncbi:D-alanyl-D-alanine carboxypeptidase/D-alanyl-D-alanine-endopeptidase [Streptomyces sp. NBC_01142]|uniref:D-alanyl-D-alanine carboxypeptidase/D-alanyl-D-alanine endopeptidase n=1 Tax=Streptomyces sp. NBC_01142 TaxID=2975865 RepID=UPI0022507E36|nr:D-alanyl-D-alanine carboxypeptidase/D-alanyl-D-alanine-endopeptidase [Streptomyces sp. NBC_01142]MCX4818441.1 D-alanyl-D-alanine carboxypeptidase/D-alanyl-D-alanine-endopeptidase [Streptomyces sp. NBC_01142]
MPEVRTWQLTTGAAVVGLALAAGAVAAAGPWDSGQRKAEKEWAAARSDAGGAHHQAPARKRPAPAPSAPGVLAGLGDAMTTKGDARPTAPGDLAKMLAPLLGDPGLGSVRTASVIDVATGDRLYGKAAEDVMTPASTIKIATSVAALSALGPDHRIPTTVVASKDGKQLTLVGGGDATLDKARLATLADRTARALRDRGTATVRLTYDSSLYKGPWQHPIGRDNDNIAPVSPLMVGQGRLKGTATGATRRTGDPARDAAGAFERLLTERGVDTSAAPAPGRPADGATPVAKVFSRPLSALVERTLTTSDNDIAESLARQTALATGEEASFAGAERAVTRQLEDLKLPLTGARFADGSGLSREDRLSARLLTELLALAADPDRPELRSVVTGLPVAGFSGTLENRYSSTSPGTGLIRAKTGTLSGVNTLAGTVVASDGRLLAFAFLAGNTPSREAAQPALDRLAAALAS